MVACRLYGYGNEYETKFTCPECGAAERHVFDLEDIESANFEENAKEYDITYNFDSQTMSMDIPRTKTKLELKILKSRDYFLVYDKQEEIEKITINTDMFNQVDLNIGGVIVTSVGNNSDFLVQAY